MPNHIHVLIIDDEHFYRDTLTTYLTPCADITVVAWEARYPYFASQACFAASKAAPVRVPPTAAATTEGENEELAGSTDNAA